MKDLTPVERENLIYDYIQAIWDSMDMDDLFGLLQDVTESRLEKLTDEELIEEIKEYHPDLLEEE